MTPTSDNLRGKLATNLRKPTYICGRGYLYLRAMFIFEAVHPPKTTFCTTSRGGPANDAMARPVSAEAFKRTLAETESGRDPEREKLRQKNSAVSCVQDVAMDDMTAEFSAGCGRKTPRSLRPGCGYGRHDRGVFCGRKTPRSLRPGCGYGRHGRGVFAAEIVCCRCMSGRERCRSLH